MVSTREKIQWETSCKLRRSAITTPFTRMEQFRWSSGEKNQLRPQFDNRLERVHCVESRDILRSIMLSAHKLIMRIPTSSVHPV